MSPGGLFLSRASSTSTVFRGSSVDSVGRIPSRLLRMLEARRRWRITSSRHRVTVTVMVGVSVIRAGSSDRPETTCHSIRVAPQVWPDPRQPGHGYSTASHLCTEHQSGPDSVPQNSHRTGGGECQETRKPTHPGIGKVGPMERGPGSPDISKHINYFSGRQH